MKKMEAAIAITAIMQMKIQVREKPQNKQVACYFAQMVLNK